MSVLPCHECPPPPVMSSAPTTTTLATAEPAGLVTATEYEMNFFMEPVDDIICGKESPFISSVPPSTMGRPPPSSTMVQTHMTNMTWMNNHSVHHSHNHHFPQSHQLHPIKIHPQGLSTPPDTPPGFSPTGTSLPPSPPFVPQTTTTIVGEMWSTSYNRYMEGPIDLRHTSQIDIRHGSQIFPDHLDQSPFYVDRKYELSVQQRQSQFQMPLVPVKHPHQHPQEHHQHHMEQVEQQHQLSPSEGALLTQSQSQLSDDDLLGLTVRDLNRRLHTMTKDAQAHVKQRRRTLKNRGYAQSCRTKRQEQKSKLEIENGELKDKLAVKDQQISQVTQQFNQVTREAATLRKERESFIREINLLRNQQVPNHQQQPQHQQQQQHQQQNPHQHHPQHQQQHQPLGGLHNQQEPSPPGIYGI